MRCWGTMIKGILYWGGLSMREVASQVGITRQGFDYRKNRALTELGLLDQ